MSQQRGRRLFHIALLLQLVVGGVEIRSVPGPGAAVVITALCNPSTCDVNWKETGRSIDWGEVLSQVRKRRDVTAATRKDDYTLLVMRRKFGLNANSEVEWRVLLGAVGEILTPYLASSGGVLVIDTRRQSLSGVVGRSTQQD